MKRTLRRLVTTPLVLAAALIIFIEDVLWGRLNQLLAWLGRLPVLRTLEGLIAKLPPYAAVPLFLIPVATLLPFKIGALWLIAHGHALAGIQVFILAKVIGTAIAARLFVLTRPALLSLGWFARAYTAIMAWRERIYRALHALPAYRLARALFDRIKARMRTANGRPSLIVRRWQAILRARRRPH